MSLTLSNLTMRAGSAVDGAAVLVMERLLGAQLPKKPLGRAAELLEALAAQYGAAEHFENPDAYFIPPELPRVSVTPHDQLPGGGHIIDLRFDSAHVPFVADYRDEWRTHSENLVAHARWYRSPRPRPTILVLHGWGGGPYWVESRAFPIDYFRRLGLDVVLFQLPFHGFRAPKGQRSGALFPSPHVVRTNEAFAQAMSDLRALRLWLLDRDVPSIGVTGMSLGGYSAALYAALVPDVSFAIPMIPAVSMADLMWRHGDGTSARKRAEAAGVTHALLEKVFRVHTPLAHTPALPVSRRFIIAGRGDRITPPDQAERLWAHWQRPRIHWFPGGHLIQAGRSDAFREMGRWLHQGVLSANSPAST